MKQIFIAVIALFFSVQVASAQKIGFVDTDYILNNIPAYKTAQSQLDKLSEDWQKELESAHANIETLYKNYQAERVMLSDDMRKKREDAIIAQEEELNKLQDKYFGSEGELAKKQEALIKPIQEEVYKAIKALALEGGYTAILDTSADATVIYANPKQDKSDEVLEKLGYK